MIVHQTVGVAAPVIPIDDMREQRKKRCPVLMIDDDVLPGIAATRDMIHGIREFNAEQARHEAGG